MVQACRLIRPELRHVHDVPKLGDVIVEDALRLGIRRRCCEETNPAHAVALVIAPGLRARYPTTLISARRGSPSRTRVRASCVAAATNAASPTFCIASYAGPVDARARAYISGSENSHAKGTSTRSTSMKPYLAKQILADAGPTQCHHRRLILDLRGRRQPKRGERPGTWRHLDVAPHGEPDPAAGCKDTMDLTEGFRGRSPDAAEAGRNIEARVSPRHRVHVTHPNIGIGVPVARNGDEARRRVNTRAVGASSTRQLDGQARAAGHVKKPVTVAHTEAVVHGHVLTAVARFAQRGEIDGFAAPAFVNDSSSHSAC